MLYLDFSKIGGGIDELSQKFDAYSAIQLNGFMNRYQEYYSDEFVATFRSSEKAHSYILELKYLPKDKFETQATVQWDAAVEQIHGYAGGEKVRQLCRGTRLHCIVMQFCGWELARIEEV